MIGDPWITAFNEVAPEFEKLTGAKIIVDGYGYDATHEKEVLEGSQKSSTTDIVVLDAPWVGQFAEGGYVEDLKPYINKTSASVIEYNDYLKVFRGRLRLEGQDHRDAFRRITLSRRATARTCSRRRT